MEGGGEGYVSARRKGFWQDHLYDIDVLGMVFHFCFLAVDAEVETIYIAPLLFIREIEVCPAVAEELFAKGGAVVLIGVGPAVDPDKGKGVGGVIGVVHAGEAVEAFFRVIQGDVDGVVDLLLPVGAGSLGRGGTYGRCGLRPCAGVEEAGGKPQ